MAFIDEVTGKFSHVSEHIEDDIKVIGVSGVRIKVLATFANGDDEALFLIARPIVGSFEKAFKRPLR